MSSQITDRPNQTITAIQGEAITALSMLLAEYAELPAPYITMHPTPGHGFGIQLDSPRKFEVWRQALGVDPGTVDLKSHRDSAWLKAEVQYRGICVHLTGHGVELPETADEPQAVAA